MKKQKGLGLIGVLLIIGVLALTVGGMVVWQKVAPTPTPTPAPQTQPTTSPEKPVSCQTAADCPPSIGVCGAGNCPSWRCIGGRCIYFKDAKNFESCLKICLEVAPAQECYEEFGR